MANSHVLLGINPDLTLLDVMNGKKNIRDVVFKTNSGVELVSGGAATSELLNLTNNQRYTVLNSIEEYLSDKNNAKLIVDIAGAEDNSIVFANACNRIVVVIIGEPTSFIDSYALIKAINATSSFKNFSIVVNQTENYQQSIELFKNLKKSQ